MARLRRVIQAGMSWENRMVLPAPGGQLTTTLLLAGSPEHLDRCLAACSCQGWNDAAEVAALEVAEVVVGVLGVLVERRPLLRPRQLLVGFEEPRVGAVLR